MCLSLIAVCQDDRTAAAVQYDALSSLADRGLTAIFGIHAEQVLGLLAWTRGDSDQAVSHFEDALSISRDHGHLCNLAWTCCDYADALRERNGQGDKEKAIALLDEALTISSELGMRPLTERVLARREFLSA